EEILGLTQGVTSKDIEKQFRRMIQANHPDKHPLENREFYERRTVAILRASEEIKRRGMRDNTIQGGAADFTGDYSSTVDTSEVHREGATKSTTNSIDARINPFDFTIRNVYRATNGAEGLILNVTNFLNDDGVEWLWVPDGKPQIHLLHI